MMKQTIVDILNVANLLGFVWLLLGWICFASSLQWFCYGGFYLFFGTWIIECILEKRFCNWHWDIRHIYFLIVIFFFLLAFIYMPWDSATHFQRLIEHRLGLLGFGIVGLWGLNRYYSLQRIFILLDIISLILIGYICLRIPWEEVSSFLSFQHIFSTVRGAYVSAHMQFDFFLNTALIGTWYLLFRSPIAMEKWTKILCISAAIVIFATLLQTEGRSGFLASLLLMSSFFVIELWRKNHWLAIVMCVLFMVGDFVAVYFHGRFAENYFIDLPRLNLWKSAIEIINEQPIVGFGISNAQENFAQVNFKYATDSYIQYWQSQQMIIDTHNQYLQTILEFGILGLILLLTIYILPMIIPSNHRALNVYIIGLSMYQSVFDMFVTGSFCVFFSVLLLIIMVVPNQSDTLLSFHLPRFLFAKSVSNNKESNG